MKIADGRAEHVHIRFLFGSFADLCAIESELRRVTIAACAGSSGMKTAAKYWSVGPAQWKGQAELPPPLIFLIGRRSMFLLNW